MKRRPKLGHLVIAGVVLYVALLAATGLGWL